MVTADEFARSLRGTAAFLNRRPEGMRDFEVSWPAFRRSFAAIALTLPAYVVALALTRSRLGLPPIGHDLFDRPDLAGTVALCHVAAFMALPLAMIPIARRLGLCRRYVGFVIASNWIAAIGSYVLAVPGALLLIGWETPALARLFALAFAVIVLHVQWFAARVTLGVGPALAAAITLFGYVLASGASAAVQTLV